MRNKLRREVFLVELSSRKEKTSDRAKVEHNPSGATNPMREPHELTHLRKREQQDGVPLCVDVFTQDEMEVLTTPRWVVEKPDRVCKHRRAP